MKILIIGASGQLGSALMHECLKHSINVTGTAHRRWSEGLLEANLTEENSLKEIFDSVRPDVTVLCAGLTDVDYCQAHPEAANIINVEAAQVVAKLCNTCASRLVYISTDYIFDGACGPYTEDALASPLNTYGKTKLEGEKACAKAKAGCLVVRTSGLYSCATDSPNLVTQLLIKSKNGERVLVANDQFFTPTYAPDLATAVLLLILKDQTGVFNAAGPDLLAQSDWAKMICVRLGLDAGIVEALPSAQLGQPAPRPLKAGLVCDKLYDETGFSPMRCANALSLVRAQLSGTDISPKPRKARKKTARPVKKESEQPVESIEQKQSAGETQPAELAEKAQTPPAPPPPPPAPQPQKEPKRPIPPSPPPQPAPSGNGDGQ